MNKELEYKELLMDKTIENFKSEFEEFEDNYQLYFEKLKNLNNEEIKKYIEIFLSDNIEKQKEVSKKVFGSAMNFNLKKFALVNYLSQQLKNPTDKLVFFLKTWNIIREENIVYKDKDSKVIDDEKLEGLKINYNKVVPFDIKQLRKIVLFSDFLADTFKIPSFWNVNFNFIDVSEINKPLSNQAMGNPNFVVEYENYSHTNPLEQVGVFENLKGIRYIDISKWKFYEGIQNFNRMFANSDVDVKLPEDMKNLNIFSIEKMFYNNKKFNSSISNINFDNIENANAAFYGAKNFDQKLKDLFKKKTVDVNNLLNNSGITNENLVDTIISISKLKNYPLEKTAKLLGEEIGKRWEELKTFSFSDTVEQKIEEAEMEEFINKMVKVLNNKPELKEKLISELGLS